MVRIFLIIIGAWLFVGCDKNDINTGVIAKVRVVMPEGVLLDGVAVEWTNGTTGAVYRAKANADGISESLVEQGIYRMTVTQRVANAGEYCEDIFSGSLEQLMVKEAGIDTLVSLSHVRLSQLVVKEVYYTGCYTDEQQPYPNDNYLSLYNNSSDTVWLDGICVGMAGPPMATSASEWLNKNPALPEIPIHRCGWQFPGKGRDNPLAPGCETVIAVCAVDHTGGKYGHSQSVDLSFTDWAFYKETFNPDFSGITPGVKPLSLFWLNWTNPIINPSFLLGVSGPGIIVYRMEGDAEAYAREHLRYVPGKPSKPNNQYLVIPREWVIDYVECVDGQQYVNFKRVPAVLDKSTVFVSGSSYTGKSLHRKVLRKIGGRIIYQDTNDSANDFEERIPSLKK